MTTIILCPAQTHARTMVSTAEFCENEVDQEGDLCAKHDADARMEDDYDRHLDNLRFGDLT